jgi:hypothetical protein
VMQIHALWSGKGAYKGTPVDGRTGKAADTKFVQYRLMSKFGAFICKNARARKLVGERLGMPDVRYLNYKARE